MPLSRRILASVSAIVTGLVLVSLLESATHWIHPPPTGLNLNDITAVKEFVAAMPPMAFIVLLAVYAASAFGAGVVGTLVAKRVS